MAEDTSRFVDRLGTAEGRAAAAEAERQKNIASIRERAAAGQLNRGLNVKEVMDLTGLDFNAAGGTLGTSAVSKTRDPRNFNAIALAEDPLAALREANRQLIESSFYETDRRPASEVPTIDPAKLVGNIQGPLALERGSVGADPYLRLQVITPQGTKLTQTGLTADSLQDTLQRFGYGVTQDQLDALQRDAEAFYASPEGQPGILPGRSGGGGRGQQLLQVLQGVTPLEGASSGIESLLLQDRIGRMQFDPIPSGNDPAVQPTVQTANRVSSATPAFDQLAQPAQPAPAQALYQPLIETLGSTFQGTAQAPDSSMAGTLADYYSNMYASPYYSYYGTPHMFDSVFDYSVFDSGVYNPGDSNQ